MFREGLHLDVENLCFNLNKDDLLNDEEKFCMVDTKASI